MKIASALTLASLLLIPLAGSAAETTVAGAQKTLETARANLAKAVQAIQKDPPSNADLDAAHAAVEALKTAIEAGAAFEASDLDYAKAVLAARKELRTQRDYTDQRRAMVKIFDQRRVIDAALAALNEKAKATEPKDASVKDFEEAAAAVAAVKKAVEEGRPFGKQDPKFAAWLAETDAAVAKHEKAFDERGTKLLVDKRRADVEQARQALTTAMAAVTKGATDVQFKAADEASAGLAKRLEEGKALEAKDKTYRADADKARTELAQAKKKLEEAWGDAGVARLKGEIEPANQELVASLKALRTKKPTDEQLAGAKTAAIVARKLIEKFAPEAARSQAFGQYVNDVKKTLVEVETELVGRGLDAARADVVTALKAIEKKTATDENFQEVETAVVVLEKTLATVPKDPATAKVAGDAKTLVKDARAAVAKRRQEVEISRQKTKVDDARKVASDLLKEMQQPKSGPEQITAAENGIKLLGSVLAEGAALAKKDRDYATFEKDTNKRIAEFNERIVARKKALAVSEARAKLTAALADTKAKLETAKLAESTDAQVDEAQKSLEAMGKLIETQAPFEQLDQQGYAMQAVRVWNQDFPKLAEALDFARQARDLRRQTVDTFAAGVKEADVAAAGELRTQKAHWVKAADQFRSCEKDGGAMLRRNPKLEKAPVVVEGHPATPKDVVELCVKRAEAAEKSVKEVVPLIAFDDGPKKAYLAAKALMGKNQKPEAIAQFDECVTTGVILSNRNPELKDHPFDLGGTSLTLSEVISQCQANRKTLRGK